MKHHKLLALTLVALQFSCLIYLLITTPVRFSAASFVFLVGATVLLLWSVASMSRSKLRVLPDPAKDATLVVRGPYRVIRHPMYTSLILGSAALVTLRPSPERVSTLLILIVVLLIKLNLEERMLARKFPEYSNYQKKTYRLIPLIF
jgi:protein-S-isoprenylcysteine O-methyltransferase Ste14